MCFEDQPAWRIAQFHNERFHFDQYLNYRKEQGKAVEHFGKGHRELYAELIIGLFPKRHDLFSLIAHTRSCDQENGSWVLMLLMF